MVSYAVVVPSFLHQAYSQLPAEEQLSVGQHLETLAEVAAAIHEAGAGETTWSDLAGVSTGDHRQLFGELWLAYRISPGEQTLQLLDLGDASLTSRVSARPNRSDWRHARPDEDGWSNEGGGNPAPIHPPHLHVVREG